VPKIVQLAFISIEDQRFYAHQGVDIRGTIKAIFAVLIHHSTDVAGGSTITQQLIKNTVLTSEVSIERKVKEWKLAVELENEMSKDEIMEAYLNQINMSITWGIENAAERYFGEDVSELSVAQSAVLAAIVKAPSTYNPYDYETDEDGNTYLVRTTDADGNTVIGYDEDNQARALLIVAKCMSWVISVRANTRLPKTNWKTI
jgi:penicillin-binding protein 1A